MHFRDTATPYGVVLLTPMKLANILRPLWGLELSKENDLREPVPQQAGITLC